MRRRSLLTYLTSASVVVAGCSGADDESSQTDTATDAPTENPTPEPTPEFSSQVDWPRAAVRGDQTSIHVEVENPGDAPGEFEATLTKGDVDVSSESVTLDPGETTTLLLPYVPGSTGTFDLSVAGETESIAVLDNELAFAHEAMAEVDTLHKQKDLTESGTIDIGEGPVDWAKEATTTVEKNFEEETRYDKDEADLMYDQTPLEETTEKWYVDGVVYEKKTKHTEGKIEFNRRLTDKPRSGSVLDIHGTPTEAFLSFEHTAGEYVFAFAPQNSEDATALMNRVIGEGGFLPAEHATEAHLQMRYDKRTGRATSTKLEFTLEGGDVFPALEQTVTEEYVAYGDSVDVTVPDNVKNNAN